MIVTNGNIRQEQTRVAKWFNDSENRDIVLYNMNEPDAFIKGIYLVNPKVEIKDKELLVNNSSGVDNIVVRRDCELDIEDLTLEISNGYTNYFLFKSSLEETYRDKLLHKLFEGVVNKEVKRDITEFQKDIELEVNDIRRVLDLCDLLYDELTYEEPFCEIPIKNSSDELFVLMKVYFNEFKNGEKFIKYSIKYGDVETDSIDFLSLIERLDNMMAHNNW